ncbi:Uncharacterized protein TCM_046201, partial [Theobroma cacao]
MMLSSLLRVLNLSNFEDLLLYDNDLKVQIPIAIRNVSDLKWLCLGDNLFSGHLPSTMFDHLSKLQSLDFHNNNLFGRIPTNIFKCQELEFLSLGWNDLEGSLPQEIGNLTKLIHLHLDMNNLTAIVPSKVSSQGGLETSDGIWTLAT